MDCHDLRIMGDFELSVLRALIPLQSFIGPPLGAQVEGATVVSRTEDGEELISYFSIPRDVPRVEPSDLQVGDDILIKNAGTADAELEVRDGVLYSLRVSVYVGRLPANPVFLGVEEAP